MSRSRHLHPPARALAAALPALAAALLALAVIGAAAAPVEAGAGVNPPPAEIRTLLHDAAVAHDVPPEILYAIAYQESGWRQFDANGGTLIGSDGKGIGIMQVTTIPVGADPARLMTDIAYNIDVGASILDTKWTYAPSVFPMIGDGARHCYEDWFFAVWAYNGWKAGNVYPYLIWAHMADGRGLWNGVAATAVPATSLVNGFPPAMTPFPRPQPEHWWSPAPLPKPLLGVPRAQKRVGAGHRFTVSGTLSPRHTAGMHSVEVRAYHWNRRARTWRLRRTLLTTNRDSGDITRWAVTFSLRKTGRWKLIGAALADADHAAATSKPVFVTVLR